MMRTICYLTGHTKKLLIHFSLFVRNYTLAVSEFANAGSTLQCSRIRKIQTKDFVTALSLSLVYVYHLKHILSVIYYDYKVFDFIVLFIFKLCIIIKQT